MASKKDDLIENSAEPISRLKVKFGEFMAIAEMKLALKQNPITLEQLVLDHLKDKLD